MRQIALDVFAQRDPGLHSDLRGFLDSAVRLGVVPDRSQTVACQLPITPSSQASASESWFSSGL